MWYAYVGSYRMMSNIFIIVRSSYYGIKKSIDVYVTLALLYVTYHMTRVISV